jgi:hypothetical protein
VYHVDSIYAQLGKKPASRTLRMRRSPIRAVQSLTKAQPIMIIPREKTTAERKFRGLIFRKTQLRAVETGCG